MAKRKKQRDSRRRSRIEARRRERRAEARIAMVLDPGTPLDRVVSLLREMFADQPAESEMVQVIWGEGGQRRAEAIAAALLDARRDALSLSVAADVAILAGRADEAEEYAVSGLKLVDTPDQHVRLALALAGQDRLAAAVETLDPVLAAEPGHERLQFTRGSLLREIAKLPDPPEPERATVARFLDRSGLDRLLDAARPYISDEGFLEWVEADAITSDELSEWTERAAADPRSDEARRLRGIAEWLLLIPRHEHDPLPAEALAEAEGTPEDMRRQAADLIGWALWGLWQVEAPDEGPGTAVTDLFTGIRLYAEVPARLREGMARWTVLAGCVVPVDGVWHAGSWCEAISPVEARSVMHLLVHELMSQTESFGEDGKGLEKWCREVHDLLGDLWMPEAVDMPLPDTMAALQLAVRLLWPSLIGALRGTAVTDGSAALRAVLELADPDAVWEELAANPEFETDPESGDLRWVPSDDEDAPYAYLERDDGGDIVVDADAESREELLEALRSLGHPATATVLPAEYDEDESGPPVVLPDIPTQDIPAWLRAWPDEPLQGFDDALTPRQLVAEPDGWAAAEMLIRYLEHDADQRGLRGLETGALRAQLGLEIGPENK